MSSTKVLLIVLILIVVLFIVFIAWGAGQDKTKPSDPNMIVSQLPPFMDTLNGMLSPFNPKLQANRLRPALTVFDLQSAAHYAVNILPDSHHDVRQAKFVVQPTAPGESQKTCAHVTYRDQDNLDKRNKDSNKFTFSIFKAGGTLTVECLSPYVACSCRVTLQ